MTEKDFQEVEAIAEMFRKTLEKIGKGTAIVSWGIEIPVDDGSYLHVGIDCTDIKDTDIRVILQKLSYDITGEMYMFLNHDEKNAGTESSPPSSKSS